MTLLENAHAFSADIPGGIVCTRCDHEPEDAIHTPDLGTPAATILEEPEDASERDGLRLVVASTVEPEPVAWLWEDRIPKGMVTLLVGEPGLGKSTLTLEIAARITRGQLKGDAEGTPLRVAIATAEDHLASVVVPRLTAAGADLDRVCFVDYIEDRMARDVDLPNDLDALEARISSEGLGLLIVDPLVAHLSGSIDSYKDHHVRRALSGLHRAAERTGCAVLGIVHLTKMQTRDILVRVGGSVAFRGLARSILVLGQDPDDQDGPTRVLAHGKSNVGALAPSLRVRLEGRKPTDGIETSGLAWAGVAEGVSANDLGAPPDDDQRSRTAEAIGWLKTELASGSVPVEAVMQRAKKDGIAWATVRRAKTTLRVESFQPAGGGSSPGWCWRLPKWSGAHIVAGAPDPPDDSNAAGQSPDSQVLHGQVLNVARAPDPDPIELG